MGLMVRTLAWSSLAGILTAAILAGVLSQMDWVPLLDKVTAVLGAAAVATLVLWVTGVLRAMLRWMRDKLHLRRIRKQRRRDLAAARAIRKSRPMEVGLDEVTVVLRDPYQHPRQRRGLSRREIAQALREADEATQQGDFQGAAQLLTDVLDCSPQHVDAHLARGRAYLALGDYDRALSDLVAAEEQSPDSPEPPAALGELHFTRKDYPRAIAYFDIALALSPVRPDLHFQRGLSHFYLKNYPAALEDMLRARLIDPEFPNLEAHITLARRKVKEKERAQREERAQQKARARRR
jgi:tetratricopeptide (TPR) repeat protein